MTARRSYERPRRVSIVTTILMACIYGVAFGAIQLLPQIVPGLVEESKKIPPLRIQYDKIKNDPAKTDEAGKLKTELAGLKTRVSSLEPVFRA